MKYIITEKQLNRLVRCDPVEVFAIVESLKPIEPLTDGLLEKIWHELDGKKIIAGESTFVWNRLIRSAFARAIESAITGEQHEQ